MKNTAKVILRAFFAIALIASVGFLSGRAIAASNPLTVTDANIVSKSDGVTASIAGVSGNEITNNVRFNKLGDKVDYKITLKNSGDKKLTIKSVADDNSNTYIGYSYGAYAGTEIAAGASFDFEFAATYSSAIPDRTARNQSIEISFSFAYETEAGETGNSGIIVAPTDPETPASTTEPETPKTADTPNTVDEVLRYVGIFVACAFGLVLSILLIRSANKKLKSAGLALALLVAAGIALPMTVVADDNLSAITFKSNYEIMSRLAVTYNDGVEDHTIEIENGDTLEGQLQDPQIDGYTFEGWLDENDEPFDPTKPVTDDIDIHPDLKPIHYVIAIDTDDDGDTDTTIDATFDTPVTLPTNENDKPGHTPNGWIDEDGNHYDDGEEVENLTTEDGDTINLVPDFEPNHFVVNLDTDGDGDIDQSFDVTYGEEALLPDNTGEKPGHTPNGWTDGTNHYNDGADISELAVENGGSIVFSAEWTPISYTLYLDINDNDEYEYVVELRYDEPFTLPIIDRSERRWGLRHSGWVDGGEEWGPEDDTYYAAGQVIQGLRAEQDEEAYLGTTWTGRTLTISWVDVDDEEFLSAVPDEMSYDDFRNNAWTIPLPGDPRKEGYRFIGWEVNGDGPYVSLFADFPEDSDIYVAKAVWEKKIVQVCYQGGATYSETQGEYICDSEEYGTTDYTLRHNYFTRNGYHPIDGWSTSGPNGAKAYDGGQSLDVNAAIDYCDSQHQTDCRLYLAALWTPHQTTVHFSPGEGVTDATGGPEDVVFTYGTQARFGDIATYQRPGYSQASWTCGDSANPYALVAIIEWSYYETDDLTCTAKWNANWYRIDFYKNASDATGGMHGMSPVTYGDNTPLTQNGFSRDGYSFIGWKWNNTGDLIQDGAPAGQFPVEQETTVELYAQWETVANPSKLASSGVGINEKLKRLAGTTGKIYNTTTNQAVKAVKMASALPDGFSPTEANNISAANLNSPDDKIYAWFDATENGGTIFIYNESDGPIKAQAGSLNSLFMGFTKLTDIALVADWDISDVTVLEQTFNNTAITDLSPISSWGTNKITKILGPFSSTQVSDLSPIAEWDTSNVTIFSSLLYGCRKVTDVSPIATTQRDGYKSWDISNATTLADMFAYTTNLKNYAPISNWDTSKVQSFDRTFNGAGIIDATPLATTQRDGYKSWDTSSATSFGSIFDSSKIVNIDALATWNTSKVTNMRYMFLGAPITNVDALSGWDVSKVEYFDMAFGAYSAGASKITDLSGIFGWQPKAGAVMADMFMNIDRNAVELPGWYHEN